MRFEKWEGLGNDFVVVADERATSWSDDQVRRTCDRRLGIGADGVLVVTGIDVLAPRMIVRNADGSRPEMCGNGLRCVVGYVLERLAADSQKSQKREELRALAVQTDAGKRRCMALRASGGWDVEVEMGRTRLAEAFETRTSDGRTLVFYGVDVGNPHAVCFDGWTPNDIDALGPEISRRPPAGLNVEFCKPGTGGAIDAVVWERGVGRTQACGTGACAVAVAAQARGIPMPRDGYHVALPGGPLTVRLSSDGSVRMRGPARRVFVGEF